jgi:T4-like virus tail tube protein gp19
VISTVFYIGTINMPGFNIAPLGGGYNGNGPSNTLETRRQHRWVFETIGRGTGQFSQAELLVLQTAARPSFKFEEPEMHHNQEVARFAGKQDWEPITLTWYDVEQQPDVSRGIYAWIETVVNMHSIKVTHPKFYKRTASLLMLDGAGGTSERWTMFGTWPASCNWQELNYTSTEIQTIEATMRYDRAVRNCAPAPVPQAIAPNCPV